MTGSFLWSAQKNEYLFYKKLQNECILPTVNESCDKDQTTTSEKNVYVLSQQNTEKEVIDIQNQSLATPIMSANQSFPENVSNVNRNSLDSATTTENAISQKEFEKIQDVFIEDIEIEFAQCENFPLPIFVDPLSEIKLERTKDKENNENSAENVDKNCNQTTDLACIPTHAHHLFGNFVYELDVSC